MLDDEREAQRDHVGSGDDQDHIDLLLLERPADVSIARLPEAEDPGAARAQRALGGVGEEAVADEEDDALG